MFLSASMPFGGKFLQQVLDKGPVVIVLIIVIVIGYRRYTKVIDGFVEEMRRFMLSIENRLASIEIKLNKTMRKLGIED